MESTLERDDVRLLATPATLNRLVEMKVIEPVRLVPGGNRRFRWSDVAGLAETTKED